MFAIPAYCGDAGSTEHPPSVALDLLREGLHGGVADEIFVQLCKQITNNPQPQSEQRGWQLMALACSKFGPSEAFELHLINFLLRRG